MADLFQQLGEIQRQALVAQQPQVDALKTRMALQSALVQREQELADTKAKQEYERGNLAAQLFNAYDIARMQQEMHSKSQRDYTRYQDAIAKRQLEASKRERDEKLLALANQVGYDMTEEDMALVANGDLKSISTVQNRILAKAGRSVVDPFEKRLADELLAWDTGFKEAKQSTDTMYQSQIDSVLNAAVSENEDIAEIMANDGVPMSAEAALKKALATGNSKAKLAARTALEKVGALRLEWSQAQIKYDLGALAERGSIVKSHNELRNQFYRDIPRVASGAGTGAGQGTTPPPAAAAAPVSKLQGGSLPIELLTGTNAAPAVVPAPVQSAQPTASRTGTADTWFLMKALGINPQNPKLGPVTGSNPLGNQLPMSRSGWDQIQPSFVPGPYGGVSSEDLQNQFVLPGAQ